MTSTLQFPRRFVGLMLGRKPVLRGFGTVASVQDLGISIRAFDENELNRLGITDISGLARFTPSLNIQERGPNRNEMNIRGKPRPLGDFTVN